MSVLIVGDTHLPFIHPHYLDFCKQTYNKFKCKTVVHIGDLVDNHSINYYEHDPDGWSPHQEMEKADGMLAKWFKAFPKLLLCRGNHDSLVDRKNKTAGLPKRCFKPFREIWNLPPGWIDDFEFQIDGVKYVHGSQCSGKHPHINMAINSRQSTVIGHVHTVAGVEWSASSRDIIFGMSVGCGIHKSSYAFAYGKDFKSKPILSCGVVLENGKNVQVVPMEM